MSEKPRLQVKYDQEVVPELKSALQLQNVLALPRLEKVVINVGAGQTKDPKRTETAIATLASITGQKPVVTKARKSISNFKIRQGMGIGVIVTLRGRKMYDFLDKLIHVSLPRVRDFQGLAPAAFDRQGNYTIAFREHNVFPEISGDAVESLHGLQVTICTTAQTPAAAATLLRSLGFPLKT
ncbi:MAG: 50S ribosomal protein L5 [Candidatus Kerfeldbacteria bacterium]|nr:50S ribosomal protein L5 [Candidatus Kerfeldbacteria bacterium]